jgi:hypothetical protein
LGQTSGKTASDYNPETIPEVGELDELETFVGQKRTKSGSGRLLTTFEMEFCMGNWWSRKASAFGNTVRTHFNVYGKLSILAMLFLGSDGNPVYPIFIPDGD